MNKSALALFVILLFSVQIAGATEYLQVVNTSTLQGSNLTEYNTASSTWALQSRIEVPENISGVINISFNQRCNSALGCDAVVRKNGVNISGILYHAVSYVDVARVENTSVMATVSDTIELWGKANITGNYVSSFKISYDSIAVPVIVSPSNNSVSADTTKNITWTGSTQSQYQISNTSDFTIVLTNATTTTNYSGDIIFPEGLNYVRVRGYEISGGDINITGWSNNTIIYILDQNSSTVPNSSICMVASTWAGVTNDTLDLIKYGLGTDCIEVGNVNPYGSGEMISFLTNVSEKNMITFFTMQGAWLENAYPYPNEFEPMTNWTGDVIKNYSFANTSAQTAIANAELNRLQEWSDYLNNTLIAISIDNEVWHNGLAPGAAWNDWDKFEYGDFSNDSRTLFRTWVQSIDNASTSTPTVVDKTEGWTEKGNMLYDTTSDYYREKWFYMPDSSQYKDNVTFKIWIHNNSATGADSYVNFWLNDLNKTTVQMGINPDQWTPYQYTVVFPYSAVQNGINKIKIAGNTTTPAKVYLEPAGTWDGAGVCRVWSNFSWGYMYHATGNKYEEICEIQSTVTLFNGSNLTTWNNRWSTSYTDYSQINSTNLTTAIPAGCCVNNKYNFNTDWLNFRQYELDWYYKNMYDTMKSNASVGGFTINNYKNYFSYVQKEQATALMAVKSNGEYLNSTDLIETNVYGQEEIFRQELFLNRYKANKSIWITEANPYLWDANGSEDPSHPASDISKLLLGMKTLNPDKVYIYQWDWWEHSPLEFENIKNITTYYADIPKLDNISHYRYHIGYPYGYQYENDIKTTYSSIKVERLVRALGLPAVDGAYLQPNATLDTTVESGDYIIIPDLPEKYFPAGYVYELAQNYPTSHIIWFIGANHSSITTGYEPYGLQNVTIDSGGAQKLTINGTETVGSYSEAVELNLYNRTDGDTVYPSEATCRGNDTNGGQCVMFEKDNMLIIGGGLDTSGNPELNTETTLINYLETYLDNTLINSNVYYRSNSGNVSYLFPNIDVSLSLNRGTQLEKIWHYNETKPSKYDVPYTVYANGTAITDFTAYEGDLYLFQKINASIVPNTGSIDLIVDAFNTTKFIFTVTEQGGATTMNITVNNSDPGFYVNNGELALTKDGDVVNTSIASDHQITFTNVTLGGTYELTADTPPESISNIINTTGRNWMNWSWTNPTDIDFNYTMIYINDSFIENVSTEYYNLTGLLGGDTRTISTHTVDTAGNINTTWVNQTTTTMALYAYNTGWQYIMVNDTTTMGDFGTLTGATWLANWNNTSQSFESHKVGWPYRQSLSLNKGAGVLARFSTNKTIDLVMNASYNWSVGLNMTLVGNEQVRTLSELNTSINSLGTCQADKIYYINPITQTEYTFICGESGNASISVPYGSAVWINSTAIFDRVRV